MQYDDTPTVRRQLCDRLHETADHLRGLEITNAKSVAFREECFTEYAQLLIGLVRRDPGWVYEARRFLAVCAAFDWEM